MQNPELQEPPRMIECPACEGWGYDTSQDIDTCNDACPLCNGAEMIEADTQEAKEDAAEARREARAGK